ncbi:MAG: hypothetical protein A2086_00470 [Spirochaetes bacterium GWD1_27_9]|nr:MAG: hypothetical protein A2Z98_08660 [Spirochaetes bacterium GWB1_27_13]OHD22166.1 MAG: hypothetical protein A2Y34_16005 [Spirochaetes bacterium GWC1_27_15]OHD37256.1 MAG: hypothetical protein A2086_00470 [Spirochaetes bacterium GWD1_27_9]
MEKKLTIIIPVFNEAKILNYSVTEIEKRLEKLPVKYELLFVDDGSKDDTYKVLDGISQTNKRVSFISFSRNFGKESAVFAGLENADGDACVIMDCDLQHPPEFIYQMVDLWLTGEVDVIDAVKATRGKESIFYKISSLTFNVMMNKLTSLNLKDSSDFKLLDKKVITEILKCKEKTRFFRGLSEWVGFRHKKIEFNVAERTVGTSKWSLTKLIKYSIDNIVTFSSIPLKLISFFGFFVIFLSIALIGQTVYMKLVGHAVEGFTTVIISIAFFSGTILLSLGVIGEYMSKIYEEIKGRPIYILKKSKNNENTSKSN